MDNIQPYANPVFRFRAFAFGLITGHLIYLYELKLFELPGLSAARRIVEQNYAA